MLRTIALFSILVAWTATVSLANDSDRIDLLEKEIRDLKIRILKLEEPAAIDGAKHDAPTINAGYKSISNWRKLEAGMHPNTVRKILGEPKKIDGGNVAFWYYEDEGRVTFIRDKVTSWTEPE